MTTTTATPTAPAPLPRIDPSATPPVPSTRRLLVELRKMVDTRAGRWLVATILVGTAAAAGLALAVGDDDQHRMTSLLSFAATPQALLLPVLGILLVTSEWSQRTAATTFALTPSRHQVVAAKVVAPLLLAAVAVLVAVLVAAGAAATGDADDAFADVGAAAIVLFATYLLLVTLQGVAFGLLVLSTPAAITLFFVLPAVSGLVFTTVPGLAEVAPWVDVQTAQTPIASGDFSLTSEQLAQLGTTALLWVGLPLAAGWARVARADVA